MHFRVELRLALTGSAATWSFGLSAAAFPTRAVPLRCTIGAG